MAAITLDGLPAYIRAYNQSNKQQQKLHVVAPKKGRRLECPVTLRLMVPNVVTVYLTLDHSMRSDGSLIMVNATAIGSREQVRISLLACAVWWFGSADGLPSCRSHPTPSLTTWRFNSSLSSWPRSSGQSQRHHSRLTW